LEIQLVFAFGLDKPHRRTRGSLRNRLRVPIIVLLSLNVGPDILRRHQPNCVTKAGELASEMMSAATGLHRYPAGRQPPNELHNAVAPHPPPENHLTHRIEPNDAAAVFAQINPQNRDLHGMHSLLIGQPA
jgi:hypothetical protein